MREHETVSIVGMPSRGTRCFSLRGTLEAASSARPVARLQVGAAALLLLSAGCDTSRVRLPGRSLDDASAGLDASARQGDRDAGAELDGAHVGSLRDAWAAPADSTSPSRAPFPVVSWRTQEVELEPDGRTAPLTFDLGELERPVLALRTYAADASTTARLCFQLEEVSADQTTWVPAATSVDYGDYCTDCAQRVAVGSGYGLFILPSGTDHPARVQAVALRVALRDCVTLAPLSRGAPRPRALLVQSVTYSAPDPAQTLELPVLVAEATPYTFAEGARLESVFTRMRELWRPAGIELVLRGPLVLPRPPAPVKYDATSREELAAMKRALDVLAQKYDIEPTAPRLILTPCLVRDDLLTGTPQQLVATTTHLPGGFGVRDEPDGIFVAGERCGGLSEGARYLESETIASVMAHELGHFLGLFHVREADGRQDALTDTDPDVANMMQARPSVEATRLTASQVAIVRRHLALAVSNRSRVDESQKMFR